MGHLVPQLLPARLHSLQRDVESVQERTICSLLGGFYSDVDKMHSLLLSQFLSPKKVRKANLSCLFKI